MKHIHFHKTIATALFFVVLFTGNSYAQRMSHARPSGGSGGASRGGSFNGGGAASRPSASPSASPSRNNNSSYNRQQPSAQTKPSGTGQNTRQTMDTKGGSTRDTRQTPQASNPSTQPANNKAYNPSGGTSKDSKIQNNKAVTQPDKGYSGNNNNTNRNPGNSTSNINNNRNSNVYQGGNRTNININNNTNIVVRPPAHPYPRPPYYYGGYHYHAYNPYHYHPYSPYYYGPSYHPWGFFIAAIAVTAIVVEANSQQYHYDQGVYYVQSGSGYTVVQAPVGATVPTIPAESQTVVVNEVTNNYYYGGTFYEKTDKGYTVVPPTAGTIVETLPEGGEEVKVGEVTYVKVGDVYYQPITKDGKDMYEVIQVEPATEETK